VKNIFWLDRKFTPTPKNKKKNSKKQKKVKWSVPYVFTISQGFFLYISETNLIRVAS